MLGWTSLFFPACHSCMLLQLYTGPGGFLIKSQHSRVSLLSLSFPLSTFCSLVPSSLISGTGHGMQSLHHSLKSSCCTLVKFLYNHTADLDVFQAEQRRQLQPGCTGQRLPLIAGCIEILMAISELYMYVFHTGQNELQL